jgi:hypothetical protein
MSIIDLQLATIEISTLTGDKNSAELRLNYQGKIYNLVQAFASHKLERAQQRLDQLIAKTSDPINISGKGRYLLVREVGYYSLWGLELGQEPVDLAEGSNDLALQQASIWLFQELWLQWQDLLGARQVDIFTEDLLTVNSHIQSRVEIDRLLNLDSLAPARLGAWSKLDFITFDRQLYQLTLKKIGQQLGTQLTIDIIQSMPNLLQSILVDILGI